LSESRFRITKQYLIVGFAASISLLFCAALSPCRVFPSSPCRKIVTSLFLGSARELHFSAGCQRQSRCPNISLFCTCLSARLHVRSHSTVVHDEQFKNVCVACVCLPLARARLLGRNSSARLPRNKVFCTRRIVMHPPPKQDSATCQIQ
jgi:hypothetical protein